MRYALMAVLVLSAAVATAQPAIPEDTIAGILASHPTWTREDAIALATRWGYGAPAAPAVLQMTNPVALVAAPGMIPTCQTVDDVIICDASECRGVNPYRESARAAACVKYQWQFYVPPPPPVYYPGQLVAHPYGSKAVVLGVAKARDGLDVVTLEVTRSTISAWPVGCVLSGRINGQFLWLPDTTRTQE